MPKVKCYECGKEPAYQDGMTACPFCDSVFSEVQIKVLQESAQPDIDASIDTAKSSATIIAPQAIPEDEEVSASSSKTALAADLGYVENPRHMKTLETPESAYESTAGKSSAIPPRTIDENGSDGEFRDYRLENEIGQGSFGTVYRAVQVPLDRNVAIKLLKPLPLPPNEEGDQTKHARVQHEMRIRDEFLREAQFTGKLEHPNIVPIHDIGIVSGGKQSDRPFYVMKEIKGISWQDVLKEKSREENLEIFKRVVDAIGFAHSRDILHCDLKPENVMLGEFGEVLVVDWGQAINTKLLETYRPGGTPAYCSPEMAQYWCDFGENPNKMPESAGLIGPRSDVYLLGAILFQLVTGKAPHFGLRGETPADVMRRAANNEIRRYDDFADDELLQIALRTLRLSDQEHIVTVKVLQDELKSYEDRKQSIDIRDRAYEFLENAKLNSDYESYQKAKFGFEESIDLWSENPTAQAGLQDTRLSCAALALKDQNFDLGLDMLSETDTDEEVQVKQKLLSGKRSRDRRKRLVATLGIAFAAAVLIGGGLTTYFFILNVKTGAELALKETQLDEKDEEITKKDEELQEKIIIADNAEAAAADALKKKDKAEKDAARITSAANKRVKEANEDADNRERLADQRVKAADKEAEEAKEEAEKAKKEAAAADKKVEAANKKVEDANKLVDQAVAKKEEALESQELLLYKSRVASIAEKATEGDFHSAEGLLETAKDKQSFEWRRLRLLSHPEVLSRSLFPEDDLEAAEVSGDRERLALYFADRIEVRSATELDKVISTVQVGELGVTEIEQMALSHDGQMLAVAFESVLRMINVDTGKVETMELAVQSQGVTHIEFSRDGSRMLTVGDPSSTRRSRGLESQLMTFENVNDTWRKMPNPRFGNDLPELGHARFSADGKRIVTSNPEGALKDQKAYVLSLRESSGGSESQEQASFYEWMREFVRPRSMKLGFVTSIFADAAGNEVISSFASQDGSYQLAVWRVDEGDGTVQISTATPQERSRRLTDEPYPTFDSARTIPVESKINYLDFNGEILLAAGENRILTSWIVNKDLSNLRTVKSTPFKGHGKEIGFSGILNAGSKYLSISLDSNPEVLLTDTSVRRAEQREFRLYDDEVLGAGSSPTAFYQSRDGNWNIFGNDQGVVSINANGSTDDEVNPSINWQVSAWNEHYITNQYLFAKSARDQLFRFDLLSGELEAVLTLTNPAEFKSGGDGVENRIYSLNVSRNGKFAVIQRQNGKRELEIWNLETMDVKKVSFDDKRGLDNSDEIPLVAISDDGQYIVGARVRFYVWRNDGSYVGDAGKETRQTINSIRFFADSATLVVGRKGEVKVYEVDQELEAKTYKIELLVESIGKSNVVDARTIGGKRYLLTRFVGKDDITKSGLELIQLNSDGITKIESFPGNGLQQGVITRSGKVLGISLEAASKNEPALIQFDIASATVLEPREVVVSSRIVDGEATDNRSIFGGVFETPGDDIVLTWKLNRRSNTVTVDSNGDLSNLCCIGRPQIDSIAMTSENKLVTFDNGVARLWVLNQGDDGLKSVSPAGSIRGNFQVFSVCPSGNTAFAVLSSGKKQGWIDMTTGQWTEEFPIGDDGVVTAVGWSSNSAQTALGYTNGKLSIVENGKEKIVATDALKQTGYQELRFSNDGLSLVAIQEGAALVIRQKQLEAEADGAIPGTKWISVRLAYPDDDQVSSADISSNGTRVVTGSQGGRLTLWNTDSKVGTSGKEGASERELMSLYRGFQSKVRQTRFGNEDRWILAFEQDANRKSAILLPTE